MNYKSINYEFLSEFPEFDKSYKLFFADNDVAEEEFQYIFYEGLVVHILEILLDMKDNHKRNELLFRFFSLVERMITSNDDDIVNLVVIAFFEYRRPEWIAMASEYMSQTLKKIVEEGMPIWGSWFDHNNELAQKYILSDSYGIRDDLFSIFKEYGFSLQDIPHNYAITYR